MFGKKVWNAFLTLFDRPISRFIDRAVASIPQEHWIRNDVTGVFIAEFASFLESFADEVKGFPGASVISAAMEKGSDYVEAFNHALSGGKSPQEAKKATAEQFFVDGRRRIAQAADKKAELEKLKEEYAILMEYLAFVEEKKSAAGTPPTEIDLEEVGRKVAGFNSAAVTDLNAWRAKYGLKPVQVTRPAVTGQKQNP